MVMDMIAHNLERKHKLNFFVCKSVFIIVFIALIKWTYSEFTEFVELNHSSVSDNGAQCVAGKQCMLR